MKLQSTGESQTTVRPGFSDYDTYGHGYYCAATGSLDAPSWIPQGSVRVSNTMRHAPHLSVQLRDYPHWSRPGYGSDGPERVEIQPGMCR